MEEHEVISLAAMLHRNAEEMPAALEPEPEPEPELLPCCVPRAAAGLAEKLYCAYNRGGGRPGLNYQDLPCPAWADLPPDVQAKWEAVAVETHHDAGALLYDHLTRVVRGIAIDAIAAWADDNNAYESLGCALRRNCCDAPLRLFSVTDILGDVAAEMEAAQLQLSAERAARLDAERILAAVLKDTAAADSNDADEDWEEA